ncbi:hypothetical protein DL767_010847 [Monosporascus sp. MG133]|nr:hypothetical protein DL767_010847 [Monosporascus sp. MG133]
MALNTILIPKILARTRNATSPKAQALVTAHPALDLHVIEGNTQDPDPIFAAHPDIDAVFAYTVPPDERPQAIPLIDAAERAGVKRFVFSSVDRGGDERSWDDPTPVPHFAEKYHIEAYLHLVCEGGSGWDDVAAGGSGGEMRKKNDRRMAYTILRLVAFMENLNPTSFFGAVFASLWATMPADTPLQLISLRDVGLFAAEALLAPTSPSSPSSPSPWEGRFANRAIGLAGDSRTLAEARAVYARVAGDGSQLPQAWWIVGRGMRWAMRDVGRMFDWFETVGYGIDVAALRGAEPRLQDFETWLRESSEFPFSAKVQERA